MLYGAQSHANGRITKKCDAQITLEHALLKEGSDSDHVAITAADTDKPLGFAHAKTDAAEDNVGVQLLGKGADTKVGVAAAAIAYNAELVPAAAGKVKTLPVAAATYWVVGRALTAAAADGDAVEVDDCHPYQVVVT